MNEVKKCSISGVAFTLDSDAYDTLSAYLDSLKKSYKGTDDGPEIVADIEARIAELILSTHGTDRVVEKPLIDNIIAQMGSAEDISEQEYTTTPSGEPRIPRRLYRDTENAKLGGVCAGIGRYFDIDPVWVRLAMFLPILLAFFQWIPFLHWTGSMMGNLFGIFMVCYLIMWFVVPAARTARQKLEMNGERITEQSIRETTTAAAANDVDSRAKPIVAEAVSVFGKIVLILLKLFAGLLVFGLIMAACALIIGIFAVGVSGAEFLSLGPFASLSLWLLILGIFVALIPVIMLIYALMCLLASRKPSAKTMLIIFLLWLASIIACSVVAIREHTIQRLSDRFGDVDTEVIIDGDTTATGHMYRDDDGHLVVVEGKTLSIGDNESKVNITLDKNEATLQINDDAEQATVKVSVSKNGTAVTVDEKNVKDSVGSAATTKVGKP